VTARRKHLYQNLYVKRIGQRIAGAGSMVKAQPPFRDSSAAGCAKLCALLCERSASDRDKRDKRGIKQVPSRTRNLHTRLSVLAGLVLGIAALASAGWESLSFGHVHPGHGVAVHHHHLFLHEHEHSGHAHEHSDETPAPDHHRHPGERHPHERDVPKRPTRTLLLAFAALLQPAVAQGFAVPPADPATYLILLALPLVVRPLLRSTRPRPPPCSIAVSDLLD
jgi:hypothetical protein